MAPNAFSWLLGDNSRQYWRKMSDCGVSEERDRAVLLEQALWLNDLLKKWIVVLLNHILHRQPSLACSFIMHYWFLLALLLYLKAKNTPAFLSVGKDWHGDWVIFWWFGLIYRTSQWGSFRNAWHRGVICMFCVLLLSLDQVLLKLRKDL